MNNWFILIFTIISIMNFLLLASSRISGCINILALQGGIISLISILNATNLWGILTFVFIFSIKALIFPLTLKHALRLTNTRREIEPIIGFSTSCIFGVLILVFSYWLSNKISYHFGDVLKLKLTFSIFTIFTGLFIIISRTKAITQVIGYIIFENGIYLLGNTFLIKENIIVELGIVLDLLVFVLISGIVIFRINKTFDHINASLLMKDDQKGVS